MKRVQKQSHTGGYSFILILIAAIWGFAFVAQRVGIRYIDAFSFNAFRFAIGALLVGLFFGRKMNLPRPVPYRLGLVLFLASAFQQVGIVLTTAGNAGFITGLYVLFVPLIGIKKGQKTFFRLWLAVFLSVAGLYLMNQSSDLKMNLGNLLVLVSALFWALHVQMIDSLSQRYASPYLAFVQFSLCALLSAITAFFYRLLFLPGAFELSYFQGLWQAKGAILYGGVMSVGVAYTLQLWVQKKVQPTQAAVLLSMEAVFALIGGAVFLREAVNIAMIFGALLLIAAIILMSLPKKRLTE